MRTATSPVETLGATELLREDHRRLKELFRQFEASDDDELKQQIAESAIGALEAHTVIEEEIFYPALRRVIDDKDLIVQARESHHVAKLLLAELKLMPAGSHFNAKFSLLCEGIRRHIQEEENELLPRAERSGLDLRRLGLEMSACKLRALRGPQALSTGRGLSVSGIGGVALAVGVGALIVSMLRRANHPEEIV